MKKPRNAGAIGKLKLFLQNGQRDKGLAIFKQLAKERSYYGFMAADYLQQDYALVNKPIILEEKNKLRLLLQEDFLIISEFRALKLDKEAQQFWWQAVRNLKGNDLLAAAKIAQQWKWHKQAILTVARAKYWDDVALRFPIEYEQGIQENASKQQLDTAIIYGLIRRESMFDETAGSPVGAMGLMQIMPKTGRQIAREINYPWRSKSILLQPSVNLKFGAYYYRQMLDSACTKSHFFKNALLNLMNYFLNFDSASLKTHQLLRVLLVQCRFSTF